MDSKIKAAETMRAYALALRENAKDPDASIAFAEWEKRCMEELEQLRKAQKREVARAER